MDLNNIATYSLLSNSSLSCHCHVPLPTLWTLKTFFNLLSPLSTANVYIDMKHPLEHSNLSRSAFLMKTESLFSNSQWLLN